MQEQQLPFDDNVEVVREYRKPRFFIKDGDFWTTVMMVVLTLVMVVFAGTLLFALAISLILEPFLLLILGGPVALILGVSYIAWKFGWLDKMFG